MRVLRLLKVGASCTVDLAGVVAFFSDRLRSVEVLNWEISAVSGTVEMKKFKIMTHPNDRPTRSGDAYTFQYGTQPVGNLLLGSHIRHARV